MYSQFFRFAIAGTIGFLVDAGILYAALKFGTGPYVGRLISFTCAVFVTWQINRRATFGAGRTQSWVTELLRYFAAMLGGGVCNYGAYTVALKLLPPVALSPFISVAIGSIVGMFVNFAFARLWVFA